MMITYELEMLLREMKSAIEHRDELISSLKENLKDFYGEEVVNTVHEVELEAVDRADETVKAWAGEVVSEMRFASKGDVETIAYIFGLPEDDDDDDDPDDDPEGGPGGISARQGLVLTTPDGEIVNLGQLYGFQIVGGSAGVTDDEIVDFEDLEEKLDDRQWAKEMRDGL